MHVSELPIITDKIIKRFNKFFVAGDPASCWMFTGSRNKMGYGKFYAKPRMRYAHRMAYQIAHGPFQEDLLVCHTCDNPSCVNPSHLFLGNHTDNARDMLRKKRNNHQRGDQHFNRRHPELVRRGEMSPNVKLKTEQVVAIKRLLKEGLKQTEIAEMFGVKAATISSIKCGHNWKHVDG